MFVKGRALLLEDENMKKELQRLAELFVVKNGVISLTS